MKSDDQGGSAVSGVRGPRGLRIDDGCRPPVPGQEVVQLARLGLACDDALENVLEVGERLDGIELGAADQAGDDRPMVRTAVTAGEQTVLSA